MASISCTDPQNLDLAEDEFRQLTGKINGDLGLPFWQHVGPPQG